jgi:site-specific DNA recombinase
VKKCRCKPVRQDYLDRVVWDQVVALLADPGLIQREIEKRIEETKKTSPVVLQKGAIEKQRNRLTQSMDKLLDAYQEGLIPISQLRKRMPELQKRLNTTDKELENLRSHELALDQRLQLLDVQSFTSQLDRKVHYLDIKDKKKILRLLVKEVIVGDDIIDIKHSIPFKEGKDEQNGKSYQLCTRSIQSFAG